MDTTHSQPEPPLCVDLDGTLVKLDTLHQAVLSLLRRAPLTLLNLPRWIKLGRAHTKHQVAQHAPLNVATLPYNQALLAHLKQQKASGRQLVLVTAANERTAHAVADHLQLFDDVLASTETHNLFGSAKRDALQQRYPTFDYAGDSPSDLPVWQAARHAILVNPHPKARATQPADLLIEERTPPLNTLMRALRIHQWIKNLLLFTPLLLAHRITESIPLTQTLLAFLAFSLTASAIYLLNDLLDLAADQHHPRKRNRPLAAGDLQLINGLRLIPLLLLIALPLTLLLPPLFNQLLLLYLLLTTLYSIQLKRRFGWDLLLLTLLYNLRIFAGGAASQTPVSAWLIAFSGLFFLSLALAKRCTELIDLTTQNPTEAHHRERPYQPHQYRPLFRIGLLTALLSGLVLTGYLLSDKVQQLYSQPHLLWGLLPLLLFWLLRIWQRVLNGTLHDDPLVATISDPITYCIALLICLLVHLAS